MACAGQDLGGMFPVELRGTTTAGEESGAEGSCGGGGAPEHVFMWTAPQAGVYQVSTVGSEYDTLLYVRRSCGGDELDCNDDISRNMRRSRVSLELAACETVYIFVDGYDGESVGDYTLTISGTESACDNGIDDDLDGDTDCEDLDCFDERCSGTGTWPNDWATLEERMLQEVNRYRSMGYRCTSAADDNFPPAPPLEMNALIRIAARLHSKDMGDQNYFEHESLDGRSFSDRMEMATFMGALPWGENIASGYSTAEAATAGLMDSPGHCRNIMSAEYRTIGIGYYYTDGPGFGHYWTQNFAAGH